MSIGRLIDEVQEKHPELHAGQILGHVAVYKDKHVSALTDAEVRSGIEVIWGAKAVPFSG